MGVYRFASFPSSDSEPYGYEAGEGAAEAEAWRAFMLWRAGRAGFVGCLASIDPIRNDNELTLWGWEVLTISGRAGLSQAGDEGGHPQVLLPRPFLPGLC